MNRRLFVHRPNRRLDQTEKNTRRHPWTHTCKPHSGITHHRDPILGALGHQNWINSRLSRGAARRGKWQCCTPLLIPLLNKRLGAAQTCLIFVNLGGVTVRIYRNSENASSSISDLAGAGVAWSWCSA